MEGTTQMTENSSDAAHDVPENFILMPKVQILFYVIYSTIFLLGLFGNCLVIFAVFRNKAMQTVTNYFILNLALSDILLCVMCVPFTPLYTFLQSWVFGKVLCHLVTCSQGISIYISSLTLTIIAVDRFFVITYPFRQRVKSSVCYTLILCTWLFSVVATLPYAYFVEHRSIGGDTYACQEDFPGIIRLAFGSITTVLQFVIPFFIMTVAYTLISCQLSSRAKSKPGSKSVSREQADRERKKRTNRMLIAMVAVFGLSWLPLNMMNILDDISTNMDLGWERWHYFHLLFFVTHAIAMSSTCYNPFLYAWLNENFRKEFKEILPCFDRCCFGHRGSSSAQQPLSGIRRNSTTRIEVDPVTSVTKYVHATYDNGTETVRLRTAEDAQPSDRYPQTAAVDPASPV